MSKAAMAEKTAQVTNHLEGLLMTDDQFNDRLYEAMRYSLLAGGKRLRPVLVLAACEAVGGKTTAQVLDAACAIELVHTYSLIHDDLPGMDDDDLRRGKPTNHVVYGEAMAILAGDGLLTEAFSMLARACGDTPVAAALMRELAEGAGIRGMVAGQAQDVLSEGEAIGLDHMQWIHRHKTGALILAACRMGGILGQADEASMAALSAYGRALGLAFQITDDILDVVGDEVVMGKHAGSDAKSDKATYPALLGLDKSRELAEQAVNEALSALKDLTGDGSLLAYIASKILARQS